MWSDTLSVEEATYAKSAICALKRVRWAATLLRELDRDGGISAKAIPKLFEARIAYALHQCKVEVEYQSMGAGAKLVDFYVHGDPSWLIEAVSLRESAAIKRATRDQELFLPEGGSRVNVSYLHLSSDAADEKCSEEGELLKAMERIALKARQFPDLSSMRFHVILTDMRGFLGHGGDRGDYRVIAYGSQDVQGDDTPLWRNQPILGLFDPRNNRDDARFVRQRVHFLGFVREQQYCEGEIQTEGYYLVNPALLLDDQARKTFRSYPLRPIGGSDECDWPN